MLLVGLIYIERERGGTQREERHRERETQRDTERESITKSRHVLYLETFYSKVSPFVGFVKACPVGLTDCYKYIYDFCPLREIQVALPG